MMKLAKNKAIFSKWCKFSQVRYYSGAHGPATSSVGMFVNAERSIADTFENYQKNWDVIQAFEQLRLRGHRELHACNLILQRTPKENAEQIKKVTEFMKHLGLKPDEDTKYFLGMENQPFTCFQKSF